MEIEILADNGSFRFPGGTAEKILYAALRNGISVPYACASGTCGTCKATLLSGEIIDAWPEAPGQKYLKGSDEFLLCQCCANTPAQFKVAGSSVRTIPAIQRPEKHDGDIRRAILLTDDVMSVEVRLTRELKFEAGQFMLVQIPEIPGYRAWSMVNFGGDHGTLEFVLKKKPGGRVSEWLFGNSCAGTHIELFGPLGHATFSPAMKRDLLFIAGGTGIAGVMSILSCATGAGHFDEYSGDVFFGIREEKDLFFLDRLAQLHELAGDKLHIYIAFSEQAAPEELQSLHPSLNFETGMVHSVAARIMQGRLSGYKAYIAGAPVLVNAAIGTLLQARVPTDSISYDKFG